MLRFRPDEEPKAPPGAFLFRGIDIYLYRLTRREQRGDINEAKLSRFINRGEGEFCAY